MSKKDNSWFLARVTTGALNFRANKHGNREERRIYMKKKGMLSKKKRPTDVDTDEGTDQ